MLFQCGEEVRFRSDLWYYFQVMLIIQPADLVFFDCFPVSRIEKNALSC